MAIRTPLAGCVSAALISLFAVSVGNAADQDGARQNNATDAKKMQQAPLDNDGRPEAGTRATPQAGNDQTGQTARNAGLDRKDRKFIEKAAADGMAEEELGRLAQANAGSDDVRQFGAHMTDEHGQANDELKRIAQAKGVAVPDSPDRAHQRKIKKLSKQSGAEFDRRYMADMVKDHEKDLKLFRDTAQNAKDPDVRAFAEKTAQKISEHLDMARRIAADVDMTAARAGKKEGEM